VFCIFPQETHVLVLGSETVLAISGFLLTCKYGYYTESGWDLEAEIC
jgi:hypothetical protein